MSTRDGLIRGITAVSNDLSRDQALALANDLEDCVTPRRLDKVMGLPAPASVLALTECWQAEGAVSGAELAFALRAAAHAVKTASSQIKVDLVYTGPDLPPIRKNHQALLEVVRGARTRLWLVSYTLFGAADVLAAAEERALAEVDVNLVLDHRVGSTREQQDASWAKAQEQLTDRAPSCSVWIWPEMLRPIHFGRRASLHAKCAVADRVQAFVSSANLSDAAMERNLEVGVVVTGGEHPPALDDYFGGLRQSGVLRPPPDAA